MVQSRRSFQALLHNNLLFRCRSAPRMPAATGRARRAQKGQFIVAIAHICSEWIAHEERSLRDSKNYFCIVSVLVHNGNRGGSSRT